MDRHTTGARPLQTGGAEGRDLYLHDMGGGEVMVAVGDDEWDADPVGVTIDAQQAAAAGCALLPANWVALAPGAAGWPQVTPTGARVLVGAGEQVRSVADDLNDEHLLSYIASMIAVLDHRARARANASGIDAVLAAHLAPL